MHPPLAAERQGVRRTIVRQIRTAGVSSFLRQVRPVVALVALLTSVHINVLSQAAPPGRQLVGTWTLLSLDRRDGAGTSIPIANPRGVLVHDAAGHAIQIMTRGGRAACVQLQRTRLRWRRSRHLERIQDSGGSYSLDENRSTVTYRPKGDLNPGRVGGQEVASIELTGNRLGMSIHRDAASETVRAVW